MSQTRLRTTKPTNHTPTSGGVLPRASKTNLTGPSAVKKESIANIKSAQIQIVMPTTQRTVHEMTSHEVNLQRLMNGILIAGVVA